MNGAFLQYFSVSLKRFKVPKALTSKSIFVLFFAKSCEGCAALWIINLIFFLYFLKIFFKESKFLISIL